MSIYLIAVCLMLVGFLYSSVGHGGASGYIAIWSLFSIPVVEYKPIVLILNVIIAGIAFMQYSRAGYFSWKLCWPFILTSIPFAFLGSLMAVHNRLYNILLGIALILPVSRFSGLLSFKKTNEPIVVEQSGMEGGGKTMKIMSAEKKVVLPIAMLLGAVIGYVSGLLNIGGGIFLSPVILLLGWANMKRTAAVSAAFIVCNSIAGLLGTDLSTIHFSTENQLWLTAAIIGGIAGSYYGSHVFSNRIISAILTVVLSIACIKLIFFS